MKRHGKTLAPASEKRRLADGRNAWRKMTPEQRTEFIAWIMEGELPMACPDGVLRALTGTDETPVCSCKAETSQVRGLPHASDCPAAVSS